MCWVTYIGQKTHHQNGYPKKAKTLILNMSVFLFANVDISVFLIGKFVFYILVKHI